MAKLPYEVLMHVLERTDIDTFFTFRLLDRRMHDLITKHSPTLAQAVARATFPKQRRIFIEVPDPSATNNDITATLAWLKKLRYHQLAAISYENVGSWGNVNYAKSAEDSVADDLRAAAALGWEGLERLAKIARDVQSLPAQEIPLRELSQAHQDVEGRQPYHYSADDCLIRRRELEICHRRLQYLRHASFKQIKGLRLLFDAFGRWVFGMKDIPQSKMGLGWRHAITSDEPWCAFAFAAKIGARPFWNAWWAHEDLSESISAMIETEFQFVWENRFTDLRLFEHNSRFLIVNTISTTLLRVQAGVRDLERRGQIDKRTCWRLTGDLVANTVTAQKILFARGQTAPKFVLGDARFRQKQEWQLFDFPPEPPISPDAPTFEFQKVLPEFGKIGESWKAEQKTGIEDCLEQIQEDCIARQELAAQIDHKRLSPREDPYFRVVEWRWD